MSSGSVGILNVGCGDTKIVFDKDNPADCIRAARIVKDMLRRGYALMVEVGRTESGERKVQRVHKFDATKFEYIIADYDPEAAQEEVPSEQTATPGAQTGLNDGPPLKAHGSRKKPGRPTRRVSATGVNAVAIARTAGG